MDLRLRARIGGPRFARLRPRSEPQAGRDLSCPGGFEVRAGTGACRQQGNDSRASDGCRGAGLRRAWLGAYVDLADGDLAPEVTAFH
jgi:hypothetical protein